jgi:hypothetical protein
MGNTTILGISPGTRYLGLAMMRNGDLYDWKVKTYKGVCTEDKLIKALAHIEELIITHVVSYIACKIPHASRSSFSLDILIEKIKKIAKEYNIHILIYSINEIKAYFKNNISNKKNLAEHIAERYPALLHEFKKERNNKNSYYARMFEAIAAVLYCHNSICY